MDDVFTRDFAIRLRSSRDGAIGFPFAAIAPTVLQQTSDEEILRYYAATTNFMYFLFRKMGNAEFLRRQTSNGGDERDEDPNPEQILGIEVFNLLKTDPVMRNEFPGNGETNCNPGPSTTVGEISASPGDSPVTAVEPQPDVEYSINTLEEFRKHLSTIEDANVLLRRAARSSLTLKTILETIKQGDSAESNRDDVTPRLTTLTTDWMHYPVGTNLVCADALAFHVDMVRVEGNLKIASLYLIND